MAGAAALIGTSRSRAAADFDAAIVGAGAAGLAAAKQFARAGRSFVVLEARSRIGGRAFTDGSLGAPFDAGAQYIHWAERNPWKPIADRMGATLDDDEWGKPPLVFDRGTRLSEAERLRRRSAFGRINAVLAVGAKPDRSFADAVSGGPEEVAAAAAAITRLSLGEEPERVSLADYEQLWAGDDYLVRDGYGALVARYGADVPVRLDTPATSIRWDGPGVEIETTRGVVRAGAALVTAPLGVLKHEAIRFTPGLPAETLAALDGLSMGAYTKIALKVDRARLGPIEAADWIDIGEGGAMTSFEFWPFGRDLAIAYLGGDHARGLCEAGEGAAIDFAVERLASMTGGRVREAVTGGRLAAWWTDPHARGSYSIVAPGRLASREALRAPVGERLWFAGEATAGGGAMTVGGATLEGERAAQAILRTIAG